MNSLELASAVVKYIYLHGMFQLILFAKLVGPLVRHSEAVQIKFSFEKRILS